MRSRATGRGLAPPERTVDNLTAYLPGFSLFAAIPNKDDDFSSNKSKGIDRRLL